MSADADSELATSWLGRLQNALVAEDIGAAVALFGDDCYWRDLVSFTWNIKTMEGRAEIAHMLQAQLPHLGPLVFSIDGEGRKVDGVIEAWFDFETGRARGRGHFRLKDGKGFTLLTTMTELKGHEERSGPTREKGIEHGALKNRRTWRDIRADEERELGNSKQPYCVVIGGGQGGIALGARLKRLGVPTIILEKNDRAGDSWRNRYKSLVLHDPVWYDHLPYLPFPAHWPVFTPKDMMGDWLEMYVKVMGLNYWSSSECLKAAFDEETQEWAVEVRRDGRSITLKPRHLVFATGSYGPPNEPAIEGAQSFKGEQYHSCRHQSAAPYRGKKCIVVGANSSAHDIAADLWEHDADVTMIQRSPTTVVRSETLMEVAFADLYSDEAVARGITTDKADLIFASTPFRLMAKAQTALYSRIAERDADLVTRLDKAGIPYRLRRRRRRPNDESPSQRLGLLHRRRRIGTDRQRSGHGEKRRRTERNTRAIGHPLRRNRASGRPDRLCHRLPAHERLGSAPRIAGSGRSDRAKLGFRVGYEGRSGSMGGRATQHVEAASPPSHVVSWRKFASVASLFPLCSAATESSDGRLPNACL